jgi:hypothetical protein
MLEMLSGSVRTHHRAYADHQQGKSYGRDIPDWLVAEVDRLRKAGRTQREIWKELRIGCKTYTRILIRLRSKP